LKKKKEQEDRRQMMLDESKRKSLHEDSDDHFEDSDSEGNNQAYLNQLLALYNQDPDQLTAYQQSLIKNMIKKQPSP
jgi:hypothetical protein